LGSSPFADGRGTGNAPQSGHAPGQKPGPTPGDVYFEVFLLGNMARVSAIDARSGIEVQAIGPATAARSDLERLALQKLKARLAREA
jgi:hypothetical protein